MPNKKSDFDVQKKIRLDKIFKPDKSRKGEIDTAIIPLVNHLNSLDNYYTTSSCSGRIYLLTEADKKPDVRWLLVSHERVSAEEIILALDEKRLPEERVWLRQENLILHVACRTLDDADRLLKIARDIGLRRSGIIADSNTIIVEICSTEKMDVPLSEKGRLLVSNDYVRVLVKIANEKFMRGRERLKRLFSEVKKIR